VCDVTDLSDAAVVLCVMSQTCQMERRLTFSGGVVGLAARPKEKQIVVADGNGAVSCIAVKVCTHRSVASWLFSRVLVTRRKYRCTDNALANNRPIPIIGR